MEGGLQWNLEENSEDISSVALLSPACCVFCFLKVWINVFAMEFLYMNLNSTTFIFQFVQIFTILCSNTSNPFPGFWAP